MLSRERLWQRVSGRPLWNLPWFLAAACALPWLLPERWDGQLGSWGGLLGWGLLGLGAVLLWPRRGRTWGLGLGMLGFTLLSLASLARWERALPVGLVPLEGRLAAPWVLRGKTWSTELAVSSPAALAGQGVEIRIPAEAESPLPPPGSPVRLRTELQAPEPGPAFLAERPLWRARGQGPVRRTFLHSAAQFEVVGSAAPGAWLRFRVWILARFEALGLQGTARDLWAALVLGLPPVQEDAFSAFVESGTIHTLVVSGLQVTLVMGVVEALVRRLLRRGGSWAACGAGLAYAGVVGFSAPVWRGLLMGFAWALGRGTGWKLPPVLTLHGALILWLILHPTAGCDPGFLLAWWALLGLLWGAEPLAAVLVPLLGRWALPLARVVAPWCSTLPLLALFHGSVPAWGILANLLVLPLVAFLTPVCLALTLVPLPGLVGAAAHLLTWMGVEAVPRFARVLPLATAQLWPWICLGLGWLLLAQAQAQFRRTRALTLCLLVTTGLLVQQGGIGRIPGTLSLEAVDVGQGDALLLRVPGGEATLVDTGTGAWSARRLARVLSRRGVREPLHLVLTHPHGDHAGGWATLARLRPLASTTLPELGHPASDWAGMGPAEGWKEARAVLRGTEWRRGEAEFSVRWPPSPLVVSDLNMASQVLRVRWRDRELWLMGDAGEVQERDLLDFGEPGGGGHRLLKAGHHGAASANHLAWLEALRPEAAVLTAGRNNRFGFPSPRVVEDLGRVGALPLPVGASWGVRIDARPGGWYWEGGDGRQGWIPGRPLP